MYSEDKNLTIDQAIRSLERAHQLKRDSVQSVLKESGGILKFGSERIQQEIQQDPWVLLGKVAMGSFGLGLMAARRLTSRKKVKQ